MMTITIQIPEGKKAEWKNNVLTLIDEVDDRPVTERIKTFDDAMKELGPESPFVKDYQSTLNLQLSPDIQAYLKLRIIVAALNEGWEPQFTIEEKRYYPWFFLYTKAELDEMKDKQKEVLVLFDGDANSGAYCGLACAYSYDAWSTSDSSFGSRLALKNEGLAIYCGKQFAEIWKDFVVIDRK